MIKLSYSTFGLTELPLVRAIEAVDRAGYPGIELSFHRDQFNPFEVTESEIVGLAKQLASAAVKPACVATASYFFTPSRPHEPSLMCTDMAGRKRRIDLVKRGIRIARRLGVPLVSLGSGFIRDEHVSNPAADPRALLVDSIRHCLDEIKPEDGITLLIEPEPGMYIETLAQAIDLLNEIDSPYFKLHLDLCHIYCSEQDYVAALARAAAYARYLHVSDAEMGSNLKIIKSTDAIAPDLDFASYLIYFPETADFLLLDRNHPMYFHDDLPTSDQKSRAQALAQGAGIDRPVEYIGYAGLYAGSTEFDDEIFTHLISVPGLSFDVLERAGPIIAYLRSTKDAAGRRLMHRRVANTLTGIVHYHQIPGEGTLDFGACFKALNEHGFSGYASVELYHHVKEWEKALRDSLSHLAQYV